MRETTYEPIRPEGVVDLVSGTLRRDILSGAYAPGDLLPSERDLAGQFGINRTSVREALNMLEHLGLVARRQGLRARVLDFRETGSIELLPHLLQPEPDSRGDRQVMNDVLAVVSTFWLQVAHRAVDEADDADLARLAAALGDLDGAVASGDVTGADVALATFYRALLRSTHSTVMELTANTFLRLFSRQLGPGRTPFRLWARQSMEEAVGRTRHHRLYRAVADRRHGQVTQAVTDLGQAAPASL